MSIMQFLSRVYFNTDNIVFNIQILFIIYRHLHKINFSFYVSIKSTQYAHDFISAKRCKR